MVLLKYKPETTQERIDAHMKAARDLVPLTTLISTSCGESYVDKAKGFTHGSVGVFPSRADAEAFFVGKTFLDVWAEY